MKIHAALALVLSSTVFSCNVTVWVDDAIHFDTLESDPNPHLASTDTVEELDAGVFECLPDGANSRPLTERKVSFVIAADSSGGMEDEVLAVQSLLNSFQEKLINFGMDPRVILISADSTAKSGICVDAPMGSGMCPEDSNEPGYLHVNQPVGSKDALTQILSTYDRWKDTVRPTDLVAFLVVSDDESDMDADAFQTGLTALNPQISRSAFYAVVSSATKADACAVSEEAACCFFGVKEGAVYKDIVSITGGLIEDLCMQDFEGSFLKIALDAAEKTCLSQSVV